MFIDVAGLAGDAFRLKRLVRMAFITGQRCMFPGQRESGQIMVEQYLVLPCDGIVATVALVAQLFAVRVILPMATDTRNRWQGNFGRLFMTGLT